MDRLKYLDALRGLAIVFMVLNHVGHYLSFKPLSLSIYFFIYLTVTLAAPLFLFIAGYVAFLSYQKTPSFRKFFQRGLLLIICWFLVNLFFYYDEPLERGRVLLMIGMSLILVYPLLKKLSQPIWLKVIALISIAGLALFPGLRFLLTEVQVPWLKELLVSEFPLYPWFFVLVLGAVLAAITYRFSADKQEQFFSSLGIAGVILVLTWLIGSINFGRYYLFLFSYDYGINGYWSPSFLTWLWIFGWIFIFLAVFRFFSGRKPDWFGTLADLGQHSLIFYFLQFFVIITIGNKVLAIKNSSFSGYLLISFIIIFILCCLAKSKIFAKITALSRRKLMGRIS